MVRNADKYYFPIRESILSALPLVDEFIIALGDNDTGDRTREWIESIDTDKIKIYDRVWKEEDFVESRILAKETNFALDHCTGDWCLYLQADEVLHEEDYATIRSACEMHFDNKEVEGLLFNYKHFWGDYNHYLPYHGWYKNEIRMVRNNCGIRSVGDAQSFRKDNGTKLKVKELDAYVYHYGWVRPPHLMQSKKTEHESIHHGREKGEARTKLLPHEYNYGPLGKIPKYKGSHPKVMEAYMEQLNWQEKLNQSKKGTINRPLHKHEKFKYRFLTWIENNVLGGRQIGGYTNWIKL